MVVGEHAPSLDDRGPATMGADTLTAMVHLRIVVPSDLAEKVLDLLEATPSVCNLVYLAGRRAAARGAT